MLPPNHNIYITTKHDCTPCKSLCDWLDLQGISYNPIDVEDYPCRVRDLHAAGTPTVVVLKGDFKTGVPVQSWVGNSQKTRESLIEYLEE